MACSSLNNSFMSPRISFSNGFAETGSGMKKLQSNNDSNSSTAAADFEFCVAKYAMNSADELFVNGKLVPLGTDDEDIGNQDCVSFTLNPMKVTKTTIRDELLSNDDDYYYVSDKIDTVRMKLPSVNKGTCSSGFRWKQRFSNFK